jgi:hypothetical protein
MHGDLNLFTIGLYPLERNLIKYLLAQLNGGSVALTGAILVANARQWKKQLHKVVFSHVVSRRGYHYYYLILSSLFTMTDVGCAHQYAASDTKPDFDQPHSLPPL